ncbi:hypothetical protein [Serratia microhaemolytica]|nr:hypothetical protein [Serratia microhaemolytica]
MRTGWYSPSLGQDRVGIAHADCGEISPVMMMILRGATTTLDLTSGV